MEVQVLYHRLFQVEQEILKANAQCSSQENITVLRKIYDDLRYKIHVARH